MHFSSAYFQLLGKRVAQEGTRLAPWGVPGLVLASWMVFPALTDNFKRTIGLLPPLPESEE